MKKKIIIGLLLLVIVSAGGMIKLFFTPYNGSAGIKYASTYSSKRGANIDFHIWYPASSGGWKTTVRGNGVFLEQLQVEMHL